MRFFNLCKLDISESHSQQIKSYMPVHLSNMVDKNKDLPEYILIGTCSFSIYANMMFPKAIVNRSRATCPSIFPTCLIKTMICQSTSTHTNTLTPHSYSVSAPTVTENLIDSSSSLDSSLVEALQPFQLVGACSQKVQSFRLSSPIVREGEINM